MSDDELRTALQKLAAPVSGAARPTTRDEVIAEVDRRNRRRWVGAGAVAAGVAAVLVGGSLVAGTLSDSDEGPAFEGSQADSGWTRIAESPLSPRDGEVAVWSGSEMIVVGGSDQPPCPPNADCVGPSADQRLRDGAAYDPKTDTWRAIAAAPQSVTYAQVVWAGDEAIVLVPEIVPQTDGDVAQPAATLAYDPTKDKWRRLDDPPALYGILASGTGDQPVFWESEETARGGDWMLDPESGAWSRLPDDPFPVTFDRSYTWDGQEFIFTALLSSDVDSEGEDFYQMARLDPGSREWEVVGETPVTFGDPNWFVTQGQLVNPTAPADGLGDAPGGVLDLESGEWRPVAHPAPEDGTRLTCDLPRVGIAGDWIVGGGSVLVSVDPDTTAYAPSCDQVAGTPQVGVWTGQELIVYGATDESFKHYLTIGLRWTPPAPE